MHSLKMKLRCASQHNTQMTDTTPQRRNAHTHIDTLREREKDAHVFHGVYLHVRMYACHAFVSSEDYPDVAVLASAHPMTTTNEFLSTVCSGLQFGFIALTLVGRQAVDSLRLGALVPAQLLDALEQNKFQNIMAAWFIGNFVQQV